MAISIKEFEITMRSLFTHRIKDRPGHKTLPCFKVEGVTFTHSGTYYVVQEGVPYWIYNAAMAIVGERGQGGDNFWSGEIHSVKGLIILVSLLKREYDQKFIDRLTNTIYKKLLKHALRDSNAPLCAVPVDLDLKKLQEVLAQYKDVVNPFGNDRISLAEPATYVDKVRLGIEYDLSDNSYEVSLATDIFNTNFCNCAECLTYHSSGWNDAERGDEGGFTDVDYWCGKSNPSDWTVSLCYTVDGGSDIDIAISPETGIELLDNEGEAAPATKEQIAKMVFHLKRSIAMAEREILSKMVKKEVKAKKS
ncbi:MAG: hypothetical protein LBH36_02695 [Candidatus Nomurabacteria bacterium]|jgi:hypothetical protein|nr:hypothetical protein [Candidatus Nomurabacteria bacterium]